MYYLRAVCGSCEHRVRVSVHHAGRRAKCPKCGTIIYFPASSQAYPARSDTELTRDARAKSGEVVEDVISTGQLLPEPLPTRVEGRGTTLRMKPVVHPPERQTPLLIVTLVGAVVTLAGIGMLLFRDSGQKPTTSTEPPPASPPRTPPPPAPAVVPFEKERSEVSDRFTRYIKAYNENDIGKLAGFYEADSKLVRQAFEEVFFQSTLKYEDWSVVKMDVETGKAVLQFRFSKVKTTDGKVEELKDQERTLTWVRKEDAWVISDKPEP